MATGQRSGGSKSASSQKAPDLKIDRCITLGARCDHSPGASCCPLDKAKARFPRLRKIWADGRYACLHTPRCVEILYGWVLEIVHRAAGTAGFVVLHRRWVVERTFGWLVCFRRLRKDYERNPRVSETMIYVAMVHLMLRRPRPV